MMETLLELNRWLHVSAGFIGLAAFWVPVMTRKGGKTHRFYGKIFKYSAYVVLIGAMLAVTLHMAIGFSAGEGPN